jgi:ligand-binding SRPBCC domain-containing protein
MRTFEYTDSLWIARPRDEVFDFFSEARNLELITPRWLSFNVLTPEPIEMHAGALIDYRLSWRGIPLRWRTEIEVWEPPHRFVDNQIRGPYRLWRHEHLFEEENGGTRVSDIVRYAAPGGALINRLFVARDVRRIFDHRSRRISELIGEST